MITEGALSGGLLLAKPPGITSARAVARVKRLLPKKTKIGHTGTLDPLASGILPIALGEATKTVPFVMDGRKSYVFTVAWGAETNTDDAEGEVVARDSSGTVLGKAPLREPGKPPCPSDGPRP